jgi:hypothetical protein
MYIIQEEHMKYVGIDLHTNRFTCCYLVDNSKEKQTVTFNLDAEGLKSFYATVNKDTYILIEATINTFAFASLFKDLVKEIIVANTYQLKSAGLPGKKTGKLDAYKPAEKLKTQAVSGVRQIIPAAIPPKKYRGFKISFCGIPDFKKRNRMRKKPYPLTVKRKSLSFYQGVHFWS